MLLATLFGGNADPCPPGLSCSLPDSPTLESDAAGDARASLAVDGDDGRPFDPLGLYALEMERDAAGTILAARFADRLVSLNFTRTSCCLDRQWTHTSLWTAIIHDAKAGDLSATGQTPTAAVEAVVKAWEKTRAEATAPVRATPLHRTLIASSFEAFGRIDPATAAEFLAMIDQRMGCAESLLVKPDGRVLLKKGIIEGGEACRIGIYLATHILTTMPGAREAEEKIKMAAEPAGRNFHAVLILPGGKRIVAPGVCASEDDALDRAYELLLANRSTIVPA